MAGWALAAAAMTLAACATETPPPTPQVRPVPQRPLASTPSQPPSTAEAPPRAAPSGQVGATTLEPARPPAARIGFNDLPGWNEEDHAAALDMFRASCGVEKDPAWREACLRARHLGPQDELISRAYWESNFKVEAVGPAGGEEGLLTAYFSPEYPARAAREYPYTAAVRPRPAGLPIADVGTNGGNAPWLDRAAIEATREREPLAWMKPEDLFFLQIQGSGVLDFNDGRKLRAVYSANNGQPFAGIATPMRQQGILAADNTSGEAIRGWLADHRGAEAEAIMRLNPRYIFFTLQPWDGREPTGAAGITLPPGRALAVDPSRHDYGALYWIDGVAPALTGAFPTYRRLAMALDTGSAIKGQVRADLFLGTGEAAGAEAGRVKHRLRLYRLKPVADPTLAAR